MAGFWPLYAFGQSLDVQRWFRGGGPTQAWIELAGLIVSVQPLRAKQQPVTVHSHLLNFRLHRLLE